MVSQKPGKFLADRFPKQFEKNAHRDESNENHDIRVSRLHPIVSKSQQQTHLVGYQPPTATKQDSGQPVDPFRLIAYSQPPPDDKHGKSVPEVMNMESAGENHHGRI